MSFLPESDLAYLTEKYPGFREVVDGPTHGVVLPDWLLPAGKYTSEKVDLLIQIPGGYKTTPLDMFYLFPQMRLLSTNALPKATEVSVQFGGRSWQRWSRHFDHSQWRPNVDGLHTYLKRVQQALEDGHL